MEALVTGIYVEPRAKDQRGPHPDYAVVWLPGVGQADAIHQAKTLGKAVGLARLKMRIGIRVLAKDEEAAFKALRPGISFVDVKTSCQYQLYPLPHGTQKQAVAKLLEDWGWKAKPIQPGRGRSEAMAWIIGTATPPPAAILSAFGADVVVTEHKTPKPHTTINKPVIPKKTQQLMRQENVSSSSSGPTDAWLDPRNDPWAKFKSATTASTPTATLAGASGTQRIDKIATELRAEVIQEVKQQLNQHGQGQASTNDLQTHSDRTEKRFKALESTVQEIKHQNQNFQNWFQTMDQRSAATEKAMQELQQAVQNNHQNIQQVSTAVQQTSTRLKGELQHSVGQLKNDIEGSFDKRFERLEAMMAKKFKVDE